MHPHQYPTLSLIDRVAGMPPTRFADDPAAARLELRARELLADYWSDTAWLTGLVSEVALCIVREILASERVALIDAPLASESLNSVQAPEHGGVVVAHKAHANLEIGAGLAS